MHFFKYHSFTQRFFWITVKNKAVIWCCKEALTYGATRNLATLIHVKHAAYNPVTGLYVRWEVTARKIFLC